MTKLHSMPMFWAEFFSDTDHVSAEAAKAYLFLLGHAWLRKAKLPDDDHALARMAGVGARKWASIKAEVMSFWHIENGVWTQKRLTKEWDFVCRSSEIKRSLGKKGGTRSAEKRATTSTIAPKRTLKPPTPTPTPIDISLANARLVDAPLLAVVDLCAKSKKPKEDLLFLGEQWNALAAILSLPAIDEIEPGSTRERHALARLRKMQGQDGVRELMTRIRGSPYLRGEVNGFRATFDWIVNPTNYQKIMDGNYEDRKIPNWRR